MPYCRPTCFLNVCTAFLVLVTVWFKFTQYCIVCLELLLSGPGFRDGSFLDFFVSFFIMVLLFLNFLGLLMINS